MTRLSVLAIPAFKITLIFFFMVFLIILTVGDMFTFRCTDGVKNETFNMLRNYVIGHKGNLCSFGEIENTW